VQGIENVIFDLGGVLLNLAVERTYRAFAKISGRPVSDIQRDAASMQLFLDFEKGLISAEGFRHQLRDYLQTTVPDHALDDAWNAMLLDFPPAKATLLAQLKKTYRTFLLSNTNIIHWQAFTNIIRNTGQNDFDGLFKRAYYSHQLGMRKPDGEIFQFVLTQHKLKAHETLFIDDNKQNVEAARQLGIATVHLTSPDQLYSIFQ
jgi:glucose-1-phosphatase